MVTIFCIAFAVTGCSEAAGSSEGKTDNGSSVYETQAAEETVEEVKAGPINVTSSSIDDDGLLALRCAKKGQNDEAKNISPQLSWDPVDGAACYAVYMFDESANDWIHWKVTDLTKTSLEEGEITVGYKGPYPPDSGYHTYNIYVYALKNTPDEYDKSFDVGSKRISAEEKLDTYQEKPGNIITSGHISSKYKNPQ